MYFTYRKREIFSLNSINPTRINNSLNLEEEITNATEMSQIYT